MAIGGGRVQAPGIAPEQGAVGIQENDLALSEMQSGLGRLDETLGTGGADLDPVLHGMDDLGGAEPV